MFPPASSPDGGETLTPTERSAVAAWAAGIAPVTTTASAATNIVLRTALRIDITGPPFDASISGFAQATEALASAEPRADRLDPALECSARQEVGQLHPVGTEAHRVTAGLRDLLGVVGAAPHGTHRDHTPGKCYERRRPARGILPEQLPDSCPKSLPGP